MGNKEIKIAIHGTNGGYRTITRDFVVGLFDAGRDFNRIAAVGSEAYSVHFGDGTVIFSKYKIIRDGLGDSRIGNIAFSVVVPQNAFFKGENIIRLLDRVDKEFSKDREYIKNDNLGAVRNDWAFVDKIKDDFRNEFIEYYSRETVPCGTNEAAYMYYSQNENWEEYLEPPYYGQYYPYKQVFFVKEELKGSDKNPLNALRHLESDDGDLTEKIRQEKIRQEQEKRRQEEQEKIRCEQEKCLQEPELIQLETTESSSPSSQHSIGTNGNVKTFIYSANANEKTKNFGIRTVLIAAVVSMFLLVVGTMIFDIELQKQAVEFDSFRERIDSYVKGDKLLWDTLSAYSRRWENKFEQKQSSTKYETWENVQNRIIEAMQFRKLVNNLNFESLMDTVRTYPPEQDRFEKAVKNVDSTMYDEVRSRLEGVVAKLPLYAIADSINAMVNHINDSLATVTAQELKNSVTLEKKQKKSDSIASPSPVKSSPSPQLFAATKPVPPPATVAVTQNQSPPLNMSLTQIATEEEIRNELKSGNITHAKLTEYAGIVKNSNLKKSIILAKKFWEEHESTFCDKGYQADVKKDGNLQGSALSSLVDAMCGLSREGEKRDKKKSINTLKGEFGL
jgi:hypothetical protein